jgi:hypothetical protein
MPLQIAQILFPIPAYLGRSDILEAIFLSRKAWPLSAYSEKNEKNM